MQTISRKKEFPFLGTNTQKNILKHATDIDDGENNDEEQKGNTNKSRMNETTKKQP